MTPALERREARQRRRVTHSRTLLKVHVTSPSGTLPCNSSIHAPRYCIRAVCNPRTPKDLIHSDNFLSPLTNHTPIPWRYSTLFTLFRVQLEERAVCTVLLIPKKSTLPVNAPFRPIMILQQAFVSIYRCLLRARRDFTICNQKTLLY